jgi:hypothetical protein
MAMDRASKLYRDLFSKYVKAHFSKSKAQCQNKVNTIWKTDIKAGKDVDEEKYNIVIAELDGKISKQEKNNIKSFFQRKTLNSNVVKEKAKETENEVQNLVESQDDVGNETLILMKMKLAMKTRHHKPPQHRTNSKTLWLRKRKPSRVFMRLEMLVLRGRLLCSLQSKLKKQSRN